MFKTLTNIGRKYFLTAMATGLYKWSKWYSDQQRYCICQWFHTSSKPQLRWRDSARTVTLLGPTQTVVWSENPFCCSRNETKFHHCALQCISTLIGCNCDAQCDAGWKCKTVPWLTCVDTYRHSPLLWIHSWMYTGWLGDVDRFGHWRSCWWLFLYVNGWFPHSVSLELDSFTAPSSLSPV